MTHLTQCAGGKPVQTGLKPKQTSLYRKAMKKAENEKMIFNSQFIMRSGRATPLRRKMERSEFFYWNYPRKQTKFIEFEEILKMENHDIIITKKTNKTKKIIKKQKIPKTPKKTKKYFHKSFTFDLIQNLFSNTNTINTNTKIKKIQKKNKKINKFS